MKNKKFDVSKLEKLNNPDRLKDIPPSLICEKLKKSDINTIVDIGAGTAFFSKQFLDILEARKCYVCDISDVMIEWVKQNVSSVNPVIIPVLMKESSVPLPDNLADLVLMMNLHHEIEEPYVMLKEVFRLLKKGGTIVIIDWKKEYTENGPPVEIRCLPEEVKEQLAGVGFKDIQLFSLLKHFFIKASKA